MPDGPGWRGPFLLLNTRPTVHSVLIESSDFNKGQELGSLYLQLVCSTQLASVGMKSVSC